MEDFLWIPSARGTTEEDAPQESWDLSYAERHGDAKEEWDKAKNVALMPERR